MNPLPPGPFGVIYADPAWRFETRSAKGRGRCPDGHVGAYHYETMSLEAIKALPVADIAKRDAAAFLWVINPMLDLGIEVLGAWGFRFNTIAFSG